MSLNDARELGCGRVRELSELGRRRHDQADKLGTQFVERRQRGKRLHAVDIQDGFAHRTAENDELLVRLGKFDGNLWRRDRIVRSYDHGRPLQQGADGSDVSAFKSDFGETVLRDLHRRARLLHLHAQLLHLGHGEAGIVSDDRNSRGLEDRVELFDRLFFCRSFHSKLFPVGGLPLEARPRGKTAGLHPSSRPKPDLETKRLKTRRARRQFSSLPSQTETGWGCRGSNRTGSAPPMAARSEIRSSPVYAGHAIKPLKNLTFYRWRLQSRTGSRRSGKPDNPCRTPSNRRDFPFLLSNPCGCQKEWS